MSDYPEVNWREQVGKCLVLYRSFGFFAGDEFANSEKVCDRILRDVLGEEELLGEDADAWYGALMLLETSCCVEVDLKKAGAESGPGYYQDLVTRLLEKVSEPGSVRVSEAPWKQGFVDVTLAARLRPEWTPFGRGADVSAAQSFAPETFWTDYLFVEQLLARVLGEKMSQVIGRSGVSEEQALLIFPPSEAASEALSAEEERLGLTDPDDPFGMSHPLVAIKPLLPQPGPETIEGILEASMIEGTPEDELGYPHLSTISEQFVDADAPRPLWDRWLDWVGWLLWAFAGFMILKLAHTLLFGEPYCYPFEEYLPDSDECAVPCGPGESQSDCDARAKALIEAHEATLEAGS